MQLDGIAVSTTCTLIHQELGVRVFQDNVHLKIGELSVWLEADHAAALGAALTRSAVELELVLAAAAATAAEVAAEENAEPVVATTSEPVAGCEHAWSAWSNERPETRSCRCGAVQTAVAPFSVRTDEPSEVPA